jgi:hypothetical protein
MTERAIPTSTADGATAQLSDSTVLLKESSLSSTRLVLQDGGCSTVRIAWLAIASFILLGRVRSARVNVFRRQNALLSENETISGQEMEERAVAAAQNSRELA